MLGQDAQSAAQALAPIVSSLVEQIRPAIKAAAAELEPTISRVVREEVMPQAATFGVIAILGGIVLGAAVGSYYASRGRRSTR